MHTPNNRLSINADDLKSLEKLLVAEQGLVEKGSRFLQIATSDRTFQHLSPETLASIGNALNQPDRLLAGPAILTWQNIRRGKGRLS